MNKKFLIYLLLLWPDHWTLFHKLPAFTPFSGSGFSILNINTFTMDAILKIKLEPVYIRQPSDTELINIPEQKK